VTAWNNVPLPPHFYPTLLTSRKRVFAVLKRNIFPYNPDKIRPVKKSTKSVEIEGNDARMKIIFANRIAKRFSGSRRSQMIRFSFLHDITDVSSSEKRWSAHRNDVNHRRTISFSIKLLMMELHSWNVNKYNNNDQIKHYVSNGDDRVRLCLYRLISRRKNADNDHQSYTQPQRDRPGRGRLHFPRPLPKSNYSTRASRQILWLSSYRAKRQTFKES